MLRIIFYYNHYNTLGHSTRVFSIIRGLKKYFKDKVDIIIFQGGKKQDILPFGDYATTFILPYSMDKRGLFIEEQERIYKKIISEGKMDNMFKERLSLMKAVLNKFKPDIFITEYFPFGREFWTFEVPYILQYLKDNFTCKIVGSSGYLNWIEKTHEYIRDFYDLLLIHSPEEFSRDYHLYLHKQGAAQLDRVLKEFARKINFTGFVLDLDAWEERKNNKPVYLKKGYDNFILVSRGGGIFNRKIIVVPMMVAKNFKNTYFLIICGPATLQKEMKQYLSIAKNNPNVRVIKEIPQDAFNFYLKKSDLTVSMVGYNTSVRLLYYDKKSILIPHHTSEQKWRADLLSKYISARVIQEEDFNTDELSRNIKELSASSSRGPGLDKGWFSGIQQTIERIKCLI